MGDGDREVATDNDPVFAGRYRLDPVRAHRNHPVAREEPHSAFPEKASHPPPYRRGMRLDDLAGLREQGDLHPIRRPGALQEGAKTVPEREGQLGPPRSAADHRDPQPSAPSPAVALGLGPAFSEGVDRLDPERMLLGPLDAAHGRLRADVEGENVESDRRASGGQDSPAVKVDPGRRGVYDPRAREPGQSSKIDMRLLRRVVAGDEARQHSGVGGEQVARDQGEPDPGDRLHAEALEYRHVAVSAADQNDVDRDGRGRAGGRVRAVRHRGHGRPRGIPGHKGGGGRGWESNPPDTSHASHRI